MECRYMKLKKILKCCMADLEVKWADAVLLQAAIMSLAVIKQLAKLVLRRMRLCLPTPKSFLRSARCFKRTDARLISKQEYVFYKKYFKGGAYRPNMGR